MMREKGERQKKGGPIERSIHTLRIYHSQIKAANKMNRFIQ